MEVAKQGLTFVQKWGAVVSRLVLKLKESVPPPPPPHPLRDFYLFNLWWRADDIFLRESISLMTHSNNVWFIHLPRSPKCHWTESFFSSSYLIFHLSSFPCGIACKDVCRAQFLSGGGALRFEKVPTAKRPRGAEAVIAKIEGWSTSFVAKKGEVNFFCGKKGGGQLLLGQKRGKSTSD